MADPWRDVSKSLQHWGSVWAQALVPRQPGLQHPALIQQQHALQQPGVMPQPLGVPQPVVQHQAVMPQQPGMYQPPVMQQAVPVQDVWTPLWQASSSGNAAAVADLLRRWPAGQMPLDTPSQHDGFTFAHIAAHNGHVDVLRLLLPAGARVDALSKDGRTPLLMAANNGHSEVVRVLLQAGAHVDQPDWQGGRTALRQAAFNGKAAVVAELLRGPGVQVDLADKDGWTPLLLACHSGHLDVARMLLAAGARINLADTGGRTPLLRAALNGRAALVAELLRAPGVQVEAADVEGATALFLASQGGHLEVVRLLLAAGARAAAPNKAGQTPTSACCTAPGCNPGSKAAILAALQGPAAPTYTELDASTAIVAPGGLYTGGDIVLPPSTAYKATILHRELLQAGLQVAVEVVSNVVTVNPLGLVQVVVMVAKGLHGAHETVICCKEKVGRMGARAVALVPALLELQKTLSVSLRGVEVGMVQSLGTTLMLLAKVLLEIKALIAQFEKEGKGVVKRAVMFLKAQGYQEEFAALEAEMRDCLGQLFTILNMQQFTSQARKDAFVAPEPLQVEHWRGQDEVDRRQDMQRLEGLLLHSVGGMEGLQQQLAAQDWLLQGQAVGLQQVVGWLHAMHASSAVISGHLERINDNLGDIQEGVDDISVKLQELFEFMKSSKGAVAKMSGSPPAQIIPRASIDVPEGALSQASSGAFGTVIRAVRDGGSVAVKLFNIRGRGALDQQDAMREALLLSKACHHNVVRCFGVVHDPDSDQRDSMHGSLVMEWVGGGNLYEWLQEHFDTDLHMRVQLALQVAAAMRHLHQQGLVHGDLKPQNILLQFIQGQALPEAKVCDFGLAKYNSSSMNNTYHQTKAYTQEYTSPERLTFFRRSREDDVYAFGILLYFLATSRSPFTDISSHDLNRAIAKGVRPDLDEWAGSQQHGADAQQRVVGPYCALTRQCWHQQPEQRPDFDAIFNRLTELVKS